MTYLKTNNTAPDSLRNRRARLNTLTVVVMAIAGLIAAVAQGQDPEVGNTGGYRAEKTVNDYMAGQQNPADGEFDYASNSLRTEVWVDKPAGEVYRKGQDLGVGFQTNQDAYAVVYRIDTEGLVTVLWPRSRFDDGFVFGGHEYQLPVSGSGQLNVSIMEGEGIVEAVVSQYPFDLRALELDFHHENTADRYNFRAAGDPFLAMNEVNYAVTGLKDSGEYVVTNYVSYYVHQEVDHPRYLCNQCHVEEQVAYDPYQDECTLTIEYDYSWYNGWYDNYGYYPVYGNPVYVYVDPWNYNPWVNYWYSPSYSCAPWYGWGWGWGSCYSWNYSPYYYGDSGTAYAGGYRRYSPLDRSQMNGAGGTARKTREYTGGSQMVRKNSLSKSERGTMTSRTHNDGKQRTDRASVVGRSGGRDLAYRGADAATRSRTQFDQVASRGSSRGGLRIRESGSANASRTRSTSAESRKRHTAAGEGQRAGLVPVSRGTTTGNDWRGTTRVGGRSGGTTQGGTTLGSRGSSTGSTLNSGSGTTTNSRARSSSGSKTVQPRQRNTRVWNSTGSQSGSSRSRSGSVDSRSRSGSNTRRSREAVTPRQNNNRSGSATTKSSGRSSGTIKKSSGSRESSGSKSRGSSGGSRSSGSSSRGNSGGGSRSGGSNDRSSSRR